MYSQLYIQPPAKDILRLSSTCSRQMPIQTLEIALGAPPSMTRLGIINLKLSMACLKRPGTQKISFQHILLFHFCVVSLGLTFRFGGWGLGLGFFTTRTNFWSAPLLFHLCAVCFVPWCGCGVFVDAVASWLEWTLPLRCASPRQRATLPPLSPWSTTASTQIWQVSVY